MKLLASEFLMAFAEAVTTTTWPRNTFSHLLVFASLSKATPKYCPLLIAGNFQQTNSCAYCISSSALSTSLMIPQDNTCKLTDWLVWYRRVHCS